MFAERQPKVSAPPHLAPTPIEVAPVGIIGPSRENLDRALEEADLIQQLRTLVGEEAWVRIARISSAPALEVTAEDLAALDELGA